MLLIHRSLFQLNFGIKKTSRISENLPDIYGNANELQSSLINKLRKAEHMVDQAIKKCDVCPVHFLKENFLSHPIRELNQMADNGRSLNIYENIDYYIKSKETILKRCAINVINAMKNHLRLFEDQRKETMWFDSFDMNFYEVFVKCLTYDIPRVRRKILIEGLKVNAVGKTIKRLKSLMNDRLRKRIIPFLAFLKIFIDKFKEIIINKGVNLNIFSLKIIFMSIPKQQTENALVVQSRLEKDLKNNKNVLGTSVSTIPGDHNQVCIKIIVEDEKVTLKSLGILDSYDDIPVILSREKNTIM